MDTGQPWPLQKCLLLAPYGGSQQQKYLEAFVIHRLGLKHLGCLKWSSHIRAPAAQCWAMDLRSPMTLLTLHSHHNPQYQSNLGSPALAAGGNCGMNTWQTNYSLAFCSAWGRALQGPAAFLLGAPPPAWEGTERKVDVRAHGSSSGHHARPKADWL